MGRLSGIFSASSGKTSITSSEIGRTWTLVSRPQSIRIPSPQASTDVLRERVPNQQGAAKGGEISVEECTSKIEPTKEPLQLSTPPRIDSNPSNPASSSGGLEPLVIPPGFSQRFAGFKTFFRPRRNRRQRLESDPDETYTGGPRGPAPTLEKAENTVANGNDATKILDDVETRKVSDTTEKSANSDHTGITVYRHPSKRMSMPISIVDREGDHQNPFDDMWEAARSETNASNQYTEQSKGTTESTAQSNSVYSGSDNQFSSYAGHALELSSTSRSSWCCPTLVGCNSWPTPADRRLATDSFNQLASEIYMEPLTISRDDDGQIIVNKVEEPFFSPEDRAERRRDKLLGRIRTMRSTLHIKAEPTILGSRSLRRMKTITDLSPRSCLMTTLRGKSLETLARLGGYSFLTLPGDFAPTTLGLPVCFVATINYLRCFAPAVQHLFVDPGDLETATQTYDYFAGQVLSAEKDKSTIHMTMRSSRMPGFLDEVSVPGLETRNPAQVLSVAFAFKALMAGLPGGILGSVQLYRILVNICYGHVSQGPAQRTGSCLAGIAPEDYAKVRAMSLAILALTNLMQFNVICGVFGLCSVLLYETERIFELERRTHRRPGRHPMMSSADKLTADRLAATLGPLLTEIGRGDGPDTFRAIQQEIESQRVAALLIHNWRSISRQMRIWERRGLDGRMRAAPSRTASGESEEQEQEQEQQRPD